MRLVTIATTVVVIAISLSGCGQKGPLVLPQSTAVVDSGENSSNQP